jgi:hypothetical protein
VLAAGQWRYRPPLALLGLISHLAEPAGRISSRPMRASRSRTHVGPAFSSSTLPDECVPSVCVQVCLCVRVCMKAPVGLLRPTWRLAASQRMPISWHVIFQFVPFRRADTAASRQELSPN